MFVVFLSGPLSVLTQFCMIRKVPQMRHCLVPATIDALRRIDLNDTHLLMPRPNVSYDCDPKTDPTPTMNILIDDFNWLVEDNRGLFIMMTLCAVFYTLVIFWLLCKK